jgi:hypothetical protein
MEAAALFAASQVCGVASAAAVVVSDVWLETPKWEDPVPPLLQMLDATVDFLTAQ